MVKEAYVEQDADLKSTPSPQGLGQTAASPHLCRPPLVRGLLGPKGLGMLAHPLLLGLHCSIVPEHRVRWHQAQHRPGHNTQSEVA